MTLSNKIYFYLAVFYDIMVVMKGKILTVLSIVLASMTAAHAGWEYPGEYVGQGWYEDDGSRFVISVRGGGSYGMAGIENKMGALTPTYVMDENGYIGYCTTTDCPGYIGYADLGNLPVVNDFSGFAFTAGASIGFTLPYRPQWRLELGWDHIAETDYNSSPLFEGEVILTPPSEDALTYVLFEQVGAAQSSLTSDIISAMFYYDFYDGVSKNLGQFIPYVGLGVGYAHSKAVLNLSDPYGALTQNPDMRNFGYVENDQLIFYRSESERGTIAGIGALGIAYGLTDSIFLDLGARVMYIPEIKWRLSNEDNTRHHDMFSANNMIYTNITLGLRFEF